MDSSQYLQDKAYSTQSKGHTETIAKLLSLYHQAVDEEE